MAEQLMFNNEITCRQCSYGRNLGADDYGCRNEEVYSNLERKVHKGEYSCGHGQI